MPFLSAIILLNLAFPSVMVTAESLDSLQQEEEQATEMGQILNQEIDTALTDVNKKYAEIENLKAEITNAEKTLEESEAEIAATESSIERRKAAVGDRMKTIQLNGETRTWQVLLESESLSDFFNRAYVMTILQNAENEKIESLAEEKERLAELQETVRTTQEQLQTNEAKLEEEAQAMDIEVVALKQQLSENEGTIQLIANKKITEQNRLAEEAKAAEAAQAAAKAAEEAQTAETANSSTESSDPSSEASTEPSTPEVPNTGGNETGGTGRVLYVESTAYSYTEPGSGFITAIGIDLRVQSNVIAVDPSVIPLGSLVVVDGYGYAIAGDTGGAIKGNIIDVHFNSVAECVNWGRRHNIRVEIQ
ncbi:3D domain-containing protein [Enterococcus sp. LJL128]|uniref:3D domain-containing protein n=1 Tax=Enterococcus sp. LJL51 TaxID=3416656 RepID=UPI003CF63A81